MFTFGFNVKPKKAGGVSYDANAQAFFTAASITDTTQKNAVNKLVLDLKSYNIWTKMKAIYPIIGGTSTSHKWNLVNPLDTDAAYRLAFAAGMTHSSTGMNPNATSYASTYLIPNTHLTVRNTHISIYIRTDSVAGNKMEIGSGNVTTANPSMALSSKYTGTIAFTDAYSTSTNRVSVSNSDAKGFYIGTRTAIDSAKIYKNGSSIVTSTTNETNNSMPNVQLVIGSYNFGGSIIQGTDREFAFVSIGDGLNDTEASNFNTAVQAYQTTLSRNV